MGLAGSCCASAAATRTYSQSGDEPESEEGPHEPKPPEVFLCSTGGEQESPRCKYKFPHFCKILKDVTNEDIKEVYTFEKRLGFGRFGVVNQVYLNKDPEKKFAVKSLKIESIISELEMIENELEILRQVDHSNIIQYYETYNDGTFLHIVTELCTGGELFDRIMKQHSFQEHEVAPIFEKILGAIAFLHHLGIVHRDLKPENFVFCTPDPDSEIKIIDFGLSTKCVKVKQMNNMVGTPYYIAPEVIQGVYSPACDIWSVGVILYFMLSGKPPFTGQTSSEVLGRVSHGAVFFPDRKWLKISHEAKDIILHMLDRNPDTRFTAKQCLEHPWLKKRHSPSSPMDRHLLERLRNCHKVSRFKQEVLIILLKFMHPLVVKHYTTNFRALDHDSDGYITAPDLIVCGTENGLEITESEAARILPLIDMDKDGNLSISEFLAAMVDESLVSEKAAKLAFDHFDVQRDGFITVMDLVKAFQRGTKPYTDCEIRSILEEVDLDKDGRITFSEFKDILFNS